MRQVWLDLRAEEGVTGQIGTIWIRRFLYLCEEFGSNPEGSGDC